MTPRISTIALWRSFRRILALLVLLGCIGLGTGAAVVVQASRSDQPVADAAVVMIDDAGAMARLDRARQLYSEGKISRILLAGPAIDASRDALQQRGVKQEAIIGLREPDQIAQIIAAQATLTQENLRSALLIAEPVETLRLLKIARDHDVRLLTLPVGASSEISISGILGEVAQYFRYVLLNK
ncbi:MAG: hypothetical protein CYG59_22310 [Chloroflexi bacterium]|nr:MAG: hypothetical protein CYG59_22310 [Chloroflexota bacterium]